MTACVFCFVRSYQVTINVYGSSQTPFRKSSQKRRHSNVDLLKESWKRPLGGMAMVGETYGSFVDTKPIKSKENADKLKEDKNTNVPGEAKKENLQGLIE